MGSEGKKAEVGAGRAVKRRRGSLAENAGGGECLDALLAGHCRQAVTMLPRGVLGVATATEFLGALPAAFRLGLPDVVGAEAVCAAGRSRLAGDHAEPARRAGGAGPGRRGVAAAAGAEHPGPGRCDRADAGGGLGHISRGAAGADADKAQSASRRRSWRRRARCGPRRCEPIVIVWLLSWPSPSRSARGRARMQTENGLGQTSSPGKMVAAPTQGCDSTCGRRP